jgi:hypothetical protein
MEGQDTPVTADGPARMLKSLAERFAKAGSPATDAKSSEPWSSRKACWLSKT